MAEFGTVTVRIPPGLASRLRWCAGSVLFGVLSWMDLAGADLLWSFFAAALESYRRDSVLRPFPRDYVTLGGEKDFDKLISVLHKCPPLCIVNERRQAVDSSLLKLMRWVLNPKNFTLKQVNCEKFQEIYHSVADADLSTRTSEPDFIFEVIPSSEQDLKFTRLRGDSKLVYAFHGSKVENFYSILNHGLRNSLNKVSLYGEGIYLSSDMAIAMNYSPTGKGWQNSIFGETISCIAVCEMIDHPDVKCTLKCKTDATDGIVSKELPLDGNVRKDSTTCFNSAHGSGGSARHRSRIKGSEGGEIPEKYFVVRNDDLIRVKYLLLYCPSGIREVESQGQIRTFSFLEKHRFFIAMVMYVLILMAVSICNSKAFRDWYQR